MNGSQFNELFRELEEKDEKIRKLRHFLDHIGGWIGRLQPQGSHDLDIVLAEIEGVLEGYHAELEEDGKI